MRKKILLLSYAFPPLSAAESLLNAKLALCLPEFDIDVLTVDASGLNQGIDCSLLGLVDRTFRNVYRFNPPFWLTPILFKYLRYFAIFPDKFSLLNNLMFKEATKLQVDRFDLIMTWSQWHSVHQVGRKLKLENPEIPWIAHFSDPWADNPFNPQIPGFKFLQSLLERRIFLAADQIHFTSQETLEFVRRRYPSSVSAKFVVLPHMFSSEMLPEKFRSENSQITIRYMGNFYGQRTPETFLKAFKLLADEQPSLIQNVKVEFWGKWVGKPNPNDKIDKDLRRNVSFCRPVSYVESLELMSQSDFLLLIDAPSEKSIFFPSKLVDYVGVEKPIFALTPEGTAAKIIKEYGGVVVDPKNVVEIKNRLSQFLILLNEGQAFSVNKEVVRRYEVGAVSELYRKFINQLIIKSS